MLLVTFKLSTNVYRIFKESRKAVLLVSFAVKEVRADMVRAKPKSRLKTRDIFFTFILPNYPSLAKINKNYSAGSPQVIFEYIQIEGIDKSCLNLQFLQFVHVS